MLLCWFEMVTCHVCVSIYSMYRVVLCYVVMRYFYVKKIDCLVVKCHDEMFVLLWNVIMFEVVSMKDVLKMHSAKLHFYDWDYWVLVIDIGTMWASGFDIVAWKIHGPAE